MGFSNLSYQERMARMGDTSEDKFEAWAVSRGIPFARYGFNRPPFKNMTGIPLELRTQPDYICEGKKSRKFLVECKGSAGRYLKLKLESLVGLAFWNERITVWFFIYDSKNDKYAFVNYRQMVNIADQSPIKRFENDNKPYYEIKCSEFQWEDLS